MAAAARALTSNLHYSEELKVRVHRVRETFALSVEEAGAVWIRAIDRLLPPTPVS